MQGNSVPYKIIILGSSGVGKTAILGRYTSGEFRPDTLSTVGVEYTRNEVKTSQGNIVCNIWDTAGQERYRSISKTYFHYAVGGILVFSVDDRKSFEELDEWINEFERLAQPNSVVLLVANKTDLGEERVITPVEAQDFAQRHHIDMIECSAKDGNGISEIFTILAGEVHQRVVRGDLTPIDPNKEGRVKPESEKSGCCS